ncbi:MAG: cytochrome o ubiquinol oxidase subunit III, partial [Hansschlegelia sp.]
MTTAAHAQAAATDAALEQPDHGTDFYLREEYHPENGTLLGFWLYLMSDCLIFASLFAIY